MVMMRNVHESFSPFFNRYYVTKSKNDGIMILDFFFAYMVKGLPNMSIITS